MLVNKPRLWTKKGLQDLGALIKRSRLHLGQSQGKSKLSQRDLEEYIYERTGCRVHNTTLSGIERASQEPSWNTIAILAAAGFIVHEDGTPYSAEELSAIASETFFKQSVKSVRRVEEETLEVATEDEDFLPPLTTRGGRRLKNLVLRECEKRGWGAQELIAAGCDAELYQVIMREDWFQRYPSPQLIKPLAALLSKVEYWDKDNPILTEGNYRGRVEELWTELERNGNGIALPH